MGRNPHQRGGLATDPPQLDDNERAPDASDTSPRHASDTSDASDDTSDASDDTSDTSDDTSDTSDDTSDQPPARALRAPAAVDTGAGWLLGLLLWGWVILPFTKHGPAGVRDVLRAKFLNRAPDGSELP